MNLSSPPQLKGGEFPELPARFLDIINRALRTLFEALQRVPDEAEAVDRFVTSDGAGLAVLELKNLLPRPPKHVSVTLCRNEDAPDTVTVWASSWRMANELIRVSFTGLAASKKHRINVRYR